MPPHQLRRFHFFNTFFFKKLTEKPSEAARERELRRLATSLGVAECDDPLSDCKTLEERHARMNYQRVRKWTKVGFLTCDLRGSASGSRFTWESDGTLAHGDLHLDSSWHVASRGRTSIRASNHQAHSRFLARQKLPTLHDHEPTSTGLSSSLQVHDYPAHFSIMCQQLRRQVET